MSWVLVIRRANLFWVKLRTEKEKSCLCIETSHLLKFKEILISNHKHVVAMAFYSENMIVQALICLLHFMIKLCVFEFLVQSMILTYIVKEMFSVKFRYNEEYSYCISVWSIL